MDSLGDYIYNKFSFEWKYEDKETYLLILNINLDDSKFNYVCQDVNKNVYDMFTFYSYSDPDFKKLSIF